MCKLFWKRYPINLSNSLYYIYLYYYYIIIIILLLFSFYFLHFLQRFRVENFDQVNVFSNSLLYNNLTQFDRHLVDQVTVNKRVEFVEL